MARTGMIAGMLAAAVGLVLIAATSVPAQLESLVGPERQAVIYEGDLKLDSGGIDVSSWGSGSYESVYDKTYVGPEVLKVTSQGPYQGIVLRLSRPADLKEFAASGNGYLDLRVLPAQGPRPVVTQQQTRAGGQRGAGGRGGSRGAVRPGSRGGMGGAGGGGMGGGLRGGGGGGMGGGLRGPGGGGGMGGGLRGGGGMGGGLRGGAMGGGLRGAGQPAAPPPGPGAAPGANEFRFRNMRVALFTDEGVMVADAIPVDESVKDQRGWVPVSVALSDFGGAADASAIRAVGVFVDESDVFYLGRVGLVVDRSPVRLTLKATPSITRVGNVVDFTATLKGGPIAPKISWDFDKSDGIQRQAVGGKVKYVYKNPGDYLVTCTIVDKSGIRAQTTQEMGVRVEGSE